MAALKGAFINLGSGLLGFLPNIIVFQFNPNTVTRTPTIPQPPRPSDGSGTTNAQQQPAQPGETMSFNLRIDATDFLAESNPIAAASGILPTLSALELLMVPKSSLSIDLTSLAGGGSGAHTHPPDSLPTVLFFWGPFRIVPITITSLTINETQYNTALIPIRAEVTVNLQVLTPTQMAQDSTLAQGAYKYTQGVKEVMAALNLEYAAEIGVSSITSFSF
jgi:hypothetical protein